jgi:hypothetical protein
MKPQSYNVLAKGAVLVPDYSRMKTTGRLSFVGRKVHHAPSIEALPVEARGAPVRVRDTTEWTPEPTTVEAWVPLRTPTAVVSADHDDPQQREAGAYYRERIAEGGLWPADAVTAAACGVPFDPTFGDEYPELRPMPAAPAKGKKE